MMISDKALEQVRTRSQAWGEHATRAGDIHSTHDYVVLADGTFFVVARNNLAAAKELLAAQKAALRRISG
jgi:hypothetical protein